MMIKLNGVWEMLCKSNTCPSELPACVLKAGYEHSTLLFSLLSSVVANMYWLVD